MGEVRAWARLLGSEMRLMLTRPRNLVGLVVLAIPPIAIALGMRGDTSGFLAGSGLYVPFVALLAEITMFLPVAMAMLSGDAIAGEAHTGTLRYVLTVPVSRTRLLLTKFTALCLGAAVGVAVVALTGLAAGGLLVGGDSILTMSGTTLGVGGTLGRLAWAAVFVWTGMVALAGIGLFVSTLTEQPVAVTVLVVVLVSAMWIIGNIPQLEVLAPWLVTTRWMSLLDLLRDPPFFDVLREGFVVNGVYGGLGLLGAWLRLRSADITS